MKPTLTQPTAGISMTETVSDAIPSPSETVRVPREPTPEMIQAMEDRQIEGATDIAENSIQYALWKEVWKAALAAAPQVEAGGQERLRMLRNEDAFHHLMHACQQALIRPAGALDEAELAEQLRWAIKISHGEVGRFSDDPEGCEFCGAIAGACSAYPNCPGGNPPAPEPHAKEK